MNILITGGAGFIGSELGKNLVKNGYGVKLLDNLEYGYRDNFEDNEILKNNFIQADVREKDFERYLKNIDIVFHFAGISALPECESNPSKAIEVNTTAVANVLNAIRKSNVKRFVFSSTSAVYENNISDIPLKEDIIVNPNLIYATSKFCAENFCKSYAQNYGIDIIICRFFNVFGAHQDFRRKYPPFTSYLTREITNGRVPVVYNTQEVKRDYIYVDDLLEYFIRMMTSNKKFSADVFNLSSGKGYSALDIVRNVFELSNKEVQYNTGNPDGFWDKYEELFNQNYNLSRERVKKEVFKHCIGANEKIVKEFGYMPQIDLKEGLKNIIHYQENFKR